MGGLPRHGLPEVPDFTEINPADAGLRRSSRVTRKPAYHINYMVPVSPRDEFLDNVSRIQQLDQNMGIFEVRVEKASDKLNAASKDGQDIHAHLIAAAELAQTAQEDMDWKKALADTTHRQNSNTIKALEDEVASLEATILTRVPPWDAEFADAVKYACPGRFLLDIKRSLAYKARGVTEGFREDLEQADGPGFNYYSSVVKLHAVRVVLMRRRRRGLGIKDVSTAFLQSDSYPDGTIKYICFRDPVTSIWKYYRQSGPIYGVSTERPAPQRDGKTPSHPGSSPWVSSEVKMRGPVSIMKRGTNSYCYTWTTASPMAMQLTCSGPFTN